jgi:6-pyruvoyltetrahydropterin/6-carboxytetrahydropterin synthase
MFEIKIISDFAAAHNLRNFRGRCENLHGHNWKVEVILRGSKLNETEMVIDFGEVKQATRDLLARLDHTYLNDLPYFQTRNPSSENIAYYLYQGLAAELDNEDRWVYKVSAWESKDACATYIADRA